MYVIFVRRGLNWIDKMEGANPQEADKLDINDPNLENMLVNELKAQGIFDQFRKDCLADVDTKVGKFSNL